MEALRVNTNFRLNTIKILLLTSTLLGLNATSQAGEVKSAQPLSVVYGFKEGKNKSIYLSDEQGLERIKIVDATSSDGYPSVSPTRMIKMDVTRFGWSNLYWFVVTVVRSTV